MTGLIVLFLLLVLAGPSGYAQSESQIAGPPTAPGVTSSPLNGNWNIAGNRQKNQFPAISMFLQVDGAQIVTHAHIEVHCPSDPVNGSGVGGYSLRGELAADGSFTLTQHDPRNTLQAEIRGRIPAEGSATWSGGYTVFRSPSRNCPGFDQPQTGSFTATPLAPLDGTFSGSLLSSNLASTPVGITRRGDQPTFTITAKQGDVVTRTLKSGGRYFYLPVVGTIKVKGSPCFSHGFADPVTYDTHTSIPSYPGTLRGDFLDMMFAMNDESNLTVRAYFTDPGESGLSVFEASVQGGKCANQNFRGTLQRKK